MRVSIDPAAVFQSNIPTVEGRLKIQGAGVPAETVLLKDVRQKEKFYFMVHEK